VLCHNTIEELGLGIPFSKLDLEAIGADGEQ
jgi:hypothetical protein